MSSILSHIFPIKRHLAAILHKLAVAVYKKSFIAISSCLLFDSIDSLFFMVQGLQLLLDGVLNYLPCPTEASNYVLIQSKNDEKVPNTKKELNEII
jgi:hypothetical protein